MEPKKQFDDEAIEKTSTELAKFILTKLDESKDILVVETYEKMDATARRDFLEKSTDFSIEIMKELGKSDIPFPYATRCVDKLFIALESLKKYIDGTITQSRDEIAARYLGIRNPENNKFTENCATVGQLTLKLNEIREATGGDVYDYFIKTESKVEVLAEGLSTDTSEVDIAEKKD